MRPVCSGETYASERSDMRAGGKARSEEHTSELQSQSNLVCRLLLEKKKKNEERPELARVADEPAKNVGFTCRLDKFVAVVHHGLHPASDVLRGTHEPFLLQLQFDT